MAYEDMFGAHIPTRKEQEEPVINPATESGHAMPDEELSKKVITFAEFSSGNPLFIERPTLYVKRIQEATEALIIVPDDDTHGGPYAREFYSPAIALPVPVLFGNESAVNAGASRYPLLHMPRNHGEPVEGESLDHFLLTVIILYTGLGLMSETPDRALITLGLDDNVVLEDEQSWATASHLADAMFEPLAKVNLCRLWIFIQNGRTEEEKDAEAEMYGRLLDMWGITPDFTKLRDEALDAAVFLSDYYHQVIDEAVPYNPFRELAGEGLG